MQEAIRDSPGEAEAQVDTAFRGSGPAQTLGPWSHAPSGVGGARSWTELAAGEGSLPTSETSPGVSG